MIYSEKTNCGFCGGLAKHKYSGLKGYIVNQKFDVYECTECEASFIEPLKSDNQVYEFIYKQAEIMPGYERYLRYAKLVKKVRFPLWYLSNAESAYWAVIEVLKKNYRNKADVKILEVGSGLGYLTYSLNKSGFSTLGIDISQNAVSEANGRYGSYYKKEDVFELAETSERFDCVIMMEVIEHVENPFGFIEAGLKLLKDGGRLIISTPNKTATVPGTIWHSDFPPVHLWFFTEKSLSKIVNKLKRKCSFVDFTEYSKKLYSPLYAGSIEDIQNNVPRLTVDGEVLPNMRVSNLKTKLLGIRGRYLISYLLRRIKKKTISSRSTTMCVVIE